MTRTALLIFTVLSVCAAASGPADPPAPEVSAVCEGRVLECHDGDTIFVDLAYEETVHHYASLRLKDVFAAELWAKGGPEARAKLAAVVPVGSRVIVRRFPVKSDKPWGPRYEKSFDRYLAAVWRASDGLYVNGAVK